MKIDKIMASLEAKHPGEMEYLQAVKEVLVSIEDIYNRHPEFEKAKIIERLVEPDRIFTFRPFIHIFSLHVHIISFILFHFFSKICYYLTSFKIVYKI